MIIGFCEALNKNQWLLVSAFDGERILRRIGVKHFRSISPSKDLELYSLFKFNFFLHFKDSQEWAKKCNFPHNYISSPEIRLLLISNLLSLRKDQNMFIMQCYLNFHKIISLLFPKIILSLINILFIIFI